MAYGKHDAARIFVSWTIDPSSECCTCRTKRFRKGRDVDFAQILGRGGGGSRAMDLERSCDTHGSLGAHAVQHAFKCFAVHWYSA